MTGNKCILDTSVIIQAFKANNQVVKTLDTMDEVYVPVIAIGELYYGAYKSANCSKHIAQINAFLNNCSVIEVDVNTTDEYAKIKFALSQKGKPIPENDIWIAAVSIQYGLPLFAQDQHFFEIDQLEFI